MHTLLTPIFYRTTILIRIHTLPTPLFYNTNILMRIHTLLTPPQCPTKALSPSERRTAYVSLATAILQYDHTIIRIYCYNP